MKPQSILREPARGYRNFLIALLILRICSYFMLSDSIVVVQAMKAIARDTLPLSPTERYYPQRAMLDGIANSEDIQEGVASLKEKRPPRFTGR